MLFGQSSQVSRKPALPINQVDLTKYRDESRMSDFEMQSNDDSSPIPLRVYWEMLPGYAGTAGGSENIFCDLFGKEAAEDTFWLDSSTRDQVDQ